MKVIVFLAFVAAGALVGVIAAGDELGLRVVMGCIGVVVGAAIGGAVSGIGQRARFGRGKIPMSGGSGTNWSAKWVREHGRRR